MTDICLAINFLSSNRVILTSVLIWNDLLLSLIYALSLSISIAIGYPFLNMASDFKGTGPAFSD